MNGSSKWWGATVTRTANERATTAYFDDLLSRGDVSVMDWIMSPEVEFHYPLGDLNGADAVKRYVEAVRIAFPDIHFAIADLVGDGERTAARWLLTGTQTGPFKGQAPTGVRVSVPGITLFRFVDGRIHEMWVSFDPARLMGT